MADQIEIPKNVLEDAPRVELSRRSIIMGLAAGSVVPIVGGCASLNLISEDQLAAMSATAWTEMKAKTPQTSNRQLRNSVTSTWERTVAVTPKANEEWDLAVFDSDAANAFVMPGNRVGVYRGMVELSENEDQLAAVLGHEVAHSVRQHARQRANQQLSAQAALTAGQILIGSNEQLSQFGGSLSALGGAAVQFGVILPFSRAHEREADFIGVDYMHAAGFRVGESARLWDVMEARSRGQRPPEFMSTHPDPSRRASDLRQYINAKGYDLV